MNTESKQVQRTNVEIRCTGEEIFDYFQIYPSGEELNEE